MARQAAKKAAPARVSGVELVEVKQNTPEWHAARCGIATASRFGDILAEGDQKSRNRYKRELAGEIMTERPAEQYETMEMRRGRELEPVALADYQRTTFDDVVRVGFGKNATLLRYAVVGASPDALVGAEGGVEVKTERPDLMIETLERGTPPPHHLPQVFGNMWVFERRWWDLKIFYPGMPRCVFRIQRNEQYITELARAVEVFSYDVRELVKKLRAMGVPS